MPFKSNAQRRFMYSKHPSIAKRWAKETPKGKLPEKVSKPLKSAWNGVLDNMKKKEEY